MGALIKAPVAAGGSVEKMRRGFRTRVEGGARRRIRLSTDKRVIFKRVICSGMRPEIADSEYFQASHTSSLRPHTLGALLVCVCIYVCIY